MGMEEKKDNCKKGVALLNKNSVFKKMNENISSDACIE